ncbi:hypothetical protein NC653_018625 [Populus alba x Populus x berolinensis]|uniref:Uncharacterized protein n=1 Tax=Populus alba x Populus x berolinensis TaxID=444605 RepID=A0AAD6QGU4_9ROSI|nr:hypothetical protein NC653_018625 [Populus alba x Populus x berolinensis]
MEIPAEHMTVLLRLKNSAIYTGVGSGGGGANSTFSAIALKLKSGPGITAAAKTAAEIFSGNLSIATEMHIPLMLCPTRTTLSSGGKDSMNSIKGSK